MKILPNIRPVDRFLRATIGLIILEISYFWFASPQNWLGFVLSAILLVTAALRFCPIYRILGWQFAASTRSGFLSLGAAVLALTVLAGALAYGSIFFTRKIFLEDYNAVNNFYKQTLFLSGKNDREGAIKNLDSFVPALLAFRTKYSNYQPFDLKGDTAFATDLVHAGQIMLDADPLVRTGDLHEAHLTLEKVRPIFQGILKRNGFSMLSVALVDFHDEMELMLAAANAKDAAKVEALHIPVNDKLAAVESEANDLDIAAIRRAFEQLVGAAIAGAAEDLPAKGENLKSSFVKVYLQRG